MVHQVRVAQLQASHSDTCHAKTHHRVDRDTLYLIIVYRYKVHLQFNIALQCSLSKVQQQKCWELRDYKQPACLEESEVKQAWSSPIEAFLHPHTQ